MYFQSLTAPHALTQSLTGGLHLMLSGAWQADMPLEERPPEEMDGIMDPRFLHQARAMTSCGLEANAEQASNLFSGVPLANQFQNLKFTGREVTLYVNTNSHWDPFVGIVSFLCPDVKSTRFITATANNTPQLLTHPLLH